MKSYEEGARHVLHQPADPVLVGLWSLAELDKPQRLPLIH
jgi:hypothetical protein